MAALPNYSRLRIDDMIKFFETAMTQQGERTVSFSKKENDTGPQMGLKERVGIKNRGLKNFFFLEKIGLKELNFGKKYGLKNCILTKFEAMEWKFFINLGSRMANLVKFEIFVEKGVLKN